MTDVGGVAGDQLLSYIKRVEHLLEEKAGVTADIKDAYSEAKGNGFDVKTMRKLIALRKLEEIDRQEQETLLDLYKRAIGMIDTEGLLAGGPQ